MTFGPRNGIAQYFRFVTMVGCKNILHIKRKSKTQLHKIFGKYFLCIDPLCHPVPPLWRDILKNGIYNLIVSRNHKYGQIFLFDGFLECGSEMPLIRSSISEVLALLHQNTWKVSRSCGDRVCPKIHLKKNSAWQNILSLNTIRN